MSETDRKQLLRGAYQAFADSDREQLERLLADDFMFYAPPDPGIDLATYWERCWPNAGSTEAFEFVRMIEDGDEIVVTYEATKADGKRFRNTEIATFDGDRMIRQEVYFGWDVEPARD